MTAIEDTLPEAPATVDTTAVVDEIREMNSDDWSTLEANGSGPDIPVQLEFTFSAPNEDAARELADDLVTLADYEADAVAPESDSDDWTVRGTTTEASVTEAGLDEWIVRMAAVGVQREGTLDGWAALLAD